jgi:hypothetical protein
MVKTGDDNADFVITILSFRQLVCHLKKEEEEEEIIWSSSVVSRFRFF